MIMKRSLEPELMQDLLQVKAYAEADFSKSDDSLLKCIDEYLLREGRRIVSKSLIVDIGCGPGNITERLYAKWPSAEIVGVDGSESMLALARNRANNRNLCNGSGTITYFRCDISSIVDGSFNLGKPADLIVSNSLLHHIHTPHKFWEATKALSKKGSIHFHRDLRRPFSLDEACTLQKIHLSSSPEVLVKDYLASLQAAFTVEEVQFQLSNAGLDQLKVYEVADRYLDVVGIF